MVRSYYHGKISVGHEKLKYNLDVDSIIHLFIEQLSCLPNVVPDKAKDTEA